MPSTHCYVPQCINRGNDHVINDHLQAKTAAFHEHHRYVLRYVITKTRAHIKILFFFLIQSRPVIRRIGCNAVDRASRLFCLQGDMLK